MMPKLLLSVISLTNLCLPGNTQDASTPEFGFGTGIAIYQGDLSPHRFGSLHKADLSFSLFSNIQLYSAFSLRVGYAFAAIQESDKTYTFGYKPFRGFSFKTLVNELSLQLIISPFSYSLQEDRRAVIPYAFAGAGYAFLRINRYWKDFDHSWQNWPGWVREGLAKDSAFSLPNNTLTFPAGVGIRYRAGEFFSLYAEAGHRFTKEEYLDGFSKACNPEKRDAFTTFTAGVIFQQTFHSGNSVKTVSY